MTVLDLLLGRPLASDESRGEQIGPLVGIPHLRVGFSYRQTIQAYPGGGGSHTVARQNLGVSAGLLAAAA
jgi:hypothetical protein